MAAQAKRGQPIALLAALVSAGLIFLSQSEVSGEPNALRKSSELLSRASTLMWPSTRAPSLTAAESSLAPDGGHPQNPWSAGIQPTVGSALQTLAFKWPVWSAHAPPASEASVVAKQTSGSNTIYWPGMTKSLCHQDFNDNCYPSLDVSSDEP